MVQIQTVAKGSPADRAGVVAGDLLAQVDGHPIRDVLDYRFYATDANIRLTVVRGGKKKELRLKNDEYEEIGLQFETYLMDKKRHCSNRCIFCFIDQLPRGLRPSLYFKDDDERLSFLFGNYVTLTNLSDDDVDRIIRLRISPINVSIHTTDPKLRVRMMRNRRAAETLSYLRRFAKAGITLNCQFVLCPGINDGEALRKSLLELVEIGEAIESIACVPVGLSDHRKGLTPLRRFDCALAAAVLDVIEEVSKVYQARFHRRVVYGADEFYLLSHRPIPPASFYGEFAQLENGVGMMANFAERVQASLADLEDSDQTLTVSIACGTAVQSFLEEQVEAVKSKKSGLTCPVYGVTNRCFGKYITVSGLLTGGDLLRELSGKPLGSTLFLSSDMLDHDGERFLDDMTPQELSFRLHVPVYFVDSGGEDFVDALANA